MVAKRFWRRPNNGFSPLSLVHGLRTLRKTHSHKTCAFLIPVLSKIDYYSEHSTTTTMTTYYKTGDSLDIVGGIYKKYKHATFIRYCGSKMCDVKVDGDIAIERRVRLTSIKKAATKEGTVVMTKEQYKELLEDIKELSEAIGLLELKARRYASYS
jgi:hypothetical protein